MGRLRVIGGDLGGDLGGEGMGGDGKVGKY